jgi:hypothetical protein
MSRSALVESETSCLTPQRSEREAKDVHSQITRRDAHRFYRCKGYKNIKTQEVLHKSL